MKLEVHDPGLDVQDVSLEVQGFGVGLEAQGLRLELKDYALSPDMYFCLNLGWLLDSPNGSRSFRVRSWG